MEKEISAQQSLEIIEGMINKAKNKFSDNSFLYLLWGWVIFICSVGHFIMIKFSLFNNPEYIWAATWVAVIYQIIYLVKQGKKETVKTYTDEVINYLWVSFGISMFIITVILGRGNTWITLYPIILMMYGTPTFLSGVIMRFTPLKVGGICCWCLAIAATFTPSLYVLLLLALAVVTAWIIPGYLLKVKYKKDNV
ncbi:MAG: hypothetical protein KF781_08985 [Chitinophagaceae bacterium]|nr:hypothetical protein [Chitinophagaceae bacterium]MCW5905050.1 hypothetical protein [Chitinophagaceae bacterium]